MKRWHTAGGCVMLGCLLVGIAAGDIVGHSPEVQSGPGPANIIPDVNIKSTTNKTIEDDAE